MLISIIGANSYIARNLVFYIRRQEDAIIKLYDVQEQSADGVNAYECIDFINKKSLQKIDWNSDIIYFFTGKTGTEQGFVDFNLFVDINEKYLLCFLDEYVRNQSKARIMFPSTRLIYKGNKTMSLTEDAEKEFKAVYALNKYCCEKYLEMYHNRYNIEYTILRIGVPYATLIKGARSYGTLDFFLDRALSQSNIQIFGDGLQRRTFTHIEDLCAVMLAAGTHQKCKNNIFNIGGEEMSVVELASKIAQRYQVEVTHVTASESACKLESGCTVFSSEKLDSILGRHYNHNFDKWLNLKEGDGE